jgi:hypothetical protein
VSADKTRRLTVCVDGELRQLFLGLRVRHAIGYRSAQLVARGEAVVLDGDGNAVDLDGALYNGEELYLWQGKEKGTAPDPARLSEDS